MLATKSKLTSIDDKTKKNITILKDKKKSKAVQYRCAMYYRLKKLIGTAILPRAYNE